jgi:hypothetical protein
VEEAGWQSPAGVGLQAVEQLTSRSDVRRVINSQSEVFAALIVACHASQQRKPKRGGRIGKPILGFDFSRVGGEKDVEDVDAACDNDVLVHFCCSYLWSQHRAGMGSSYPSLYPLQAFSLPIASETE